MIEFDLTNAVDAARFLAWVAEIIEDVNYSRFRAKVNGTEVQVVILDDAPDNPVIEESYDGAATASVAESIKSRLR